MTKKFALTALALAMASTAVQAANISSAAAGGLWSATTTWTGGVVPGETVAVADVVRIQNGATVTLNSTPTYTLGNVQMGRGTTTGNLVVTTGGTLNMILGSNRAYSDRIVTNVAL